MDLNFSYDSPANGPNKKNKIKGNRNSRIKARRQEKKNFRKDFAEKHLKNATENPEASDDKKLKNDDIKIKSENQEPQEKTQNKSIIRLFKDLEDCEKIQLPDESVTQVVEQVFDEKSFESLLDLHPYLIKNLKDEGKESMTKVQSESLPHILSGKDVLIKAQTGSGKTLTYAIPILNKLGKRVCESENAKIGLDKKVNREDGPYAIIICPTRELSLQSYEVLEKLGRKTFSWIVPGIVNGGLSRQAEKRKLRKGINVLVGSPGRIFDHIKQTESLSKFLSTVEFLVIDEADRLFEQTFEIQVREIINKIHEAKNDKNLPEHQQTNLQTILLSATLSPGVETLAGLALKNPVSIDLGDQAEGGPDTKNKWSGNFKDLEKQLFSIPKDLHQMVCFCPLKTKFIVLFTLVKTRLLQNEKTVVYFSTIEEVMFFYHIFKESGSIFSGEDKNLTQKILMLHGNMDQNDRNEIYHKFKSADVHYVLFSTDVTERGLHFNNVSYIIQYNPAPSIRGYVHRVGRTARVGNSGKSIVLLTPAQEPYLKHLSGSGIKVNMVQVHDLFNQLLSEIYPLSGKHKDRNLQLQRETVAVIQKYYQEYVNDEANSKIKLRAIETYQQFLRSYMTCQRELGFIAKDLHFGHLAKTFGLIDPPRELVKKVRDLSWVTNFPRNMYNQHLKKEGGEKENSEERKEKFKEDKKAKLKELAELNTFEQKQKQKEKQEKSRLHFDEIPTSKKQLVETKDHKKSHNNSSENNKNGEQKSEHQTKNKTRSITVDNEVHRARAQKQINRARLVERSKADEFDSGFLSKKARLNFAGKSNMAKRKGK